MEMQRSAEAELTETTEALLPKGGCNASRPRSLCGCARRGEGVFVRTRPLGVPLAAGVGVGLTILLGCVVGRHHSFANQPEDISGVVALLEKDPASGADNHVRLLQNKGSGDKRSYQYAVLKNGLQVLNVQDNRSRKTALAVAVRAGSFNDPLELPGLAHFCEHMLFLGTKKYPDAEGFDQFMSKHGGVNNAYTANEVTVYFAEVTESAGAQEIKRLADFFREPSFNRTFVKKEVHAINSEHLKNVQDAERRTIEVLNSLASPGSPVSRFHTGDINTLYKIPRQNGTSPVDALKLYFKNHYCPGRMRLATFGSAPLDLQLKSAEAAFGKIPRGPAACQAKVQTFADPKPFPPERMGKWVVIEGNDPQPTLWVHWHLRDLQSEYRSNPMVYLFYMLSYNGLDSFSRMLVDSLGLATAVGPVQDSSSAGTSMYLTVALTPLGSQHVELVLDLLFAYIATLKRKGLDDELYESVARILKLEWEWQEPAGASATVSDLAERMTRLPPEHLLTGDSLIEQRDSELVAHLLERLRPDNMNVALVDEAANKTGLFKGAEVIDLPYWGVKHSVGDFSVKFPEASKRWEGWLDSMQGEAALRTALHQLIKRAGVAIASTQFPIPPSPIKHIPKQLPLDSMHAQRGKDPLYGRRPQQLEVPTTVNLQLAGKPRVWYRGGWVTESPKVTIQVMFRRTKPDNDSYMSALDLLNLRIFSKLLKEETAPWLVDLTMTGVTYSVDVAQDGLTFTFVGYAPLLPQLVDKVLEHFNNFNSNFTVTRTDRFSRIVEELRQDLASYTEMPVSYALLDRELLLQRKGHSRPEALDALQHVTTETAASSAGKLVLARPLEITALVMGNLDEHEAKNTIAHIMSGVKMPSWLEPSSGTGTIEYVTPVVNFSRPVEVRALNPREHDVNDVVVVTLVAGVSTIESQIMYSMLGQILHTLTYGELRTKRQLGYVVSAGSSVASNVDYISAVVQGTVVNADEAELLIEFVLTTLMPQKLRNMTQKEFESYKDAMAESLVEPPISPFSEVNHWWDPIILGGRCFGLKQEALRYLHSPLITRETLADGWSRLSAPKHGLRRKLAVKMFATKVPTRPVFSKEKMEALSQGRIDNHVEALLAKEHGRTMILDAANSTTRHLIAAEGGYFPKALHCKLQTATEAALNALSGEAETAGIANDRLLRGL